MGDTTKILLMIVDDEEDVRVLLRAIIAQANKGLVVACEASNGTEALERWRSCKPDVIILDQRMPGLTGLDAAERILTEEPSQAIVLFSAYLDSSLKDRAKKLGIRACLSKDQIGELPRTLWALAG